MKSYWCSRLLHGLNAYLGICMTQANFEHELKELGIEWCNWLASETADATTHFLKDKKKRDVIIVCIQVKEKHAPIEVASLLVHEAVHVFQWQCRRIGEYAPSDEFEAYGIQHISQELMYGFTKLVKGLRNRSRARVDLPTRRETAKRHKASIVDGRRDTDNRPLV